MQIHKYNTTPSKYSPYAEYRVTSHLQKLSSIILYLISYSIQILGTSTLYKILNDCSASVRKCIEGLDYYVAEGGRSFQELEEIIQKLKIDDETKKSFTSRLLTGKRYLKSEYKVILLF